MMMMLICCYYCQLISKIYLVNLDLPATWLAYPSNLLAVSMQTCACTYAVSTGYVSAYGEVSQPVLVLVLIRTCTRVPLVWVVLVVVLCTLYSELVRYTVADIPVQRPCGWITSVHLCSAYLNHMSLYDYIWFLYGSTVIMVSFVLAVYERLYCFTVWCSVDM